MSAAEAYVAEMARQQALRWVAEAQATVTKDVADELAERLSHLLVALTDCDVVVCEDTTFGIWPTATFVSPERRHALGAAITAARQALDAYNDVEA